MIFALLADLVMVTHLGFVIFVVAGGLLGFIWRKVIWVHLPAALWGALVVFTGWTCPLTPLEIWLRGRAGGSGFEHGFVAHYLLPLIYPGEPGPVIQCAIGAFVIVANAAVYLCYWRWRAGREGRAWR